MAAFPSELPLPVWDIIRETEPQNVVIRTDMDAGPAKQRKRFSSGPRNLSFVIKPVSADQRLVFLSWYEFELGLGASEFTMKHPINNVDITARFNPNNAPYDIIAVGKKAGSPVFEIAMTMEILP